MLRLFARNILTVRNSFVPRSSYTIVRNMASGKGIGKANTDDLKGSKLFDVSHVTALVTGGGTGIGLMITQALVANGAKVYITGRREEALKQTIEQHDSGPGKMIA
jgi:NADPH:quinone reductase-like Zn-dependent oxidoreductase